MLPRLEVSSKIDYSSTVTAKPNSSVLALFLGAVTTLAVVVVIISFGSRARKLSTLGDHAILSYWGANEAETDNGRSLRKWLLPWSSPRCISFDNGGGNLLSKREGKSLRGFDGVETLCFVSPSIAVDFFDGCGILRSVETLYLGYMDDCTDEFVNYCFKSFPNVTYLEMNEVDVSGETLGRWTSLEVIRFTNCPVSPKALKLIAELPNLRELTLSELDIENVALTEFQGRRPDVDLYPPEPDSPEPSVWTAVEAFDEDHSEAAQVPEE